MYVFISSSEEKEPTTLLVPFKGTNIGGPVVHVSTI
jgi:hypothetical protein